MLVGVRDFLLRAAAAHAGFAGILTGGPETIGARDSYERRLPPDAPVRPRSFHPMEARRRLAFFHQRVETIEISLCRRVAQCEPRLPAEGEIAIEVDAAPDQRIEIRQGLG